MKQPIIEIQHISKKYKYGNRQPYYALRDSIVSFLMKPFSMVSQDDTHLYKDEFWALCDVSFSVEQGDILGIIGSNGAGKSTLLKILSRITPPTEGAGMLRGRVASLLEVGTGFNPELSGRENIFLNGAILGMSRAEIKKKFDEIVSFAETERFLDTPVKYYSSGMYMRLAFAVAAHLESEILLIDEVLAVGDVSFQKKCLGKMDDIAKSGRTILFVSHNMSAIETLCNRSVLLEKGRCISIGPTGKIVKEFLNRTKYNMQLPVSKREDRSGKGNITFVEVKFDKTRAPKTYHVGDDIIITATVESKYSTSIPVRLSLSIYTENQAGLITCDSLSKNKVYPIAPGKKSRIECRIYAPPLNIGKYHVNMAMFNGEEAEDWISSIADFEIDGGNFDNQILNKKQTPILNKFSWSAK